MLTQLLSSKPKSKLVNLLLSHPGRSFSLTELRVNTGMSRRMLASTVAELKRIGFVVVFARNGHKRLVRYYQMNKNFALYPELASVLRKVKKIPSDLLAKKAASLDNCKFAVLTGVFAGLPRMETDLLLVGKVKPSHLSRFLKLAYRLAEGEINYTVLAPAEFEYRKIMNDRFIKNILENNPVIVLDKTKNRSIAKLVYKL